MIDAIKAAPEMFLLGVIAGVALTVGLMILVLLISVIRETQRDRATFVPPGRRDTAGAPDVKRRTRN